MTIAPRTWWKDGVVYQIYPASFKDSNGDGLGDIPGILSKLDYIQDLGVDIIWVSPMYDSPQVDMGYDIRDYEKVYEPYGTVADMEALIDECHLRGMRIILDLVVNHTSDQHRFFRESRSWRDSAKRDWYIWRPAKYDADGNRMPPNNWRSNFSEPAWTWDEHTQEYYLHLFCKEQPDLNWDNEAARNAIYDTSMRFWLEKGVDGFRVDTVNMYSKPPSLPDAPIAEPGRYDQPAASLYCNGPLMHPILREMNQNVLSHYGDMMTVGELPHTPSPEHVLRYISSDDKQLSMVFQFDIVDLGQGKTNKFDYEGFNLSELKTIASKWQKFAQGTKGWPTVFCENHDQGRSVSRYASDDPQWRVQSAKMLATMMATMTGTLFIYQGQEIGMVNAPRSWPIDEYKDVDSQNFYKMVQERIKRGVPDAYEYMMYSLGYLARDHARLPMQWDDQPNAGFTVEGVKPWMRVHDAYPEINVNSQQRDKNSTLSFWKRMLELRKQKRDLFGHGEFQEYEPENEQTFIYSKAFGHERAIVALNFTAEEQPFQLPVKLPGTMQLVVSSYNAPKGVTLQPYEGRIYLVA